MRRTARSGVLNTPIIDALGQADLSADRSPDVLVDWIRRVGEVRCESVGATLFRQGLICREILYLEAGWVSLLRGEDTGTEMVIGLRPPGEILSAAAVLSRLPHPTSAVARTPVRLRVVSASRLERVLDEESSIRHALLAEVGKEAIAQIARSSALACLSAREHLERLLIVLAPNAVARGARIPLQTTDLADRVRR